MTGYWWVRIFDFDFQRDIVDSPSWTADISSKGVLLDEYYLKDIHDRKETKSIVSERSGITRFAKPKKDKNGTYAIVMESNQFFYDRATIMLDTYCFWCHKPVKGPLKDFPSENLKSLEDWDTNEEEKVHFCSYECKRKLWNSQNPDSEGEWQEKEDYTRNGGIFGYIYLIYNRLNDTYYIGQTRFMPMFRWQEHVKSGLKGNILDLTFSVITEVRHNGEISILENQEYLNNIEAWWISKYRDEMGLDKVINLTAPKLTIADLKEKYSRLVNMQVNLVEML